MVDPKPVSSRVSKKRATIKDVARASDVSPMTVSNVLNDKMQFVSSKTKARVEREITRLNYRRKLLAEISDQRIKGQSGLSLLAMIQHFWRISSLQKLQQVWQIP